MRSILEEFANGNISLECQSFKRNSAYRKALKALVGIQEKLLRILDEEEKKLFEKYAEAQGEINQLTASDNLIYGFKLGLMITAETFITSDELFDGEGD